MVVFTLQHADDRAVLVCISSGILGTISSFLSSWLLWVIPGTPFFSVALWGERKGEANRPRSTTALERVPFLGHLGIYGLETGRVRELVCVLWFYYVLGILVSFVHCLVVQTGNRVHCWAKLAEPLLPGLGRLVSSTGWLILTVAPWLLQNRPLAPFLSRIWCL